jgi:hypothetical protein
MAQSKKLRFHSFTIDAATRTPITADVGCNAVALRNLDTTNACTMFDADTGGGSKTLPAGSEQVFRRQANVGSYWEPGEIILWVTAVSGTGPIVVEYLM